MKRRKEPIPEDAPYSDEEKALVKKFRDKLGAKIEKFPDMTVLRFVRGFCCDEKPEERALDVLTKMADWYATEKVDEVRHQTYEWHADFLETWACGMHGWDKLGHPVYINRPGMVDVALLIKKGYDQKIMPFHIQEMEALIETEEKITALRGQPRYKHVAILDLKNLGWSHMDKRFYGVMKAIVDIDQYYYPDTLYRLFIINSPFIFRVLWAVVSPWVDPITKNKIIWGTDKLEQFIDKDMLPKDLGGTCKCEDGRCLRSKFVSGKGETMPEITVGKPKPAATSDAKAPTPSAPSKENAPAAAAGSSSSAPQNAQPPAATAPAPSAPDAPKDAKDVKSSAAGSSSSSGSGSSGSGSDSGSKAASASSSAPPTATANGTAAAAASCGTSAASAAPNGAAPQPQVTAAH